MTCARCPHGAPWYADCGPCVDPTPYRAPLDMLGWTTTTYQIPWEPDPCASWARADTKKYEDMPELTEAELKAIEERAAKATRGTWDSYPGSYVYPDGFRRSGHPGVDHDFKICSLVVRPTTAQNNPNAVADSDFIAHAREDVPRLIQEIRRLRYWAEESRQRGLERGERD